MMLYQVVVYMLQSIILNGTNHVPILKWGISFESKLKDSINVMQLIQHMNYKIIAHNVNKDKELSNTNSLLNDKSNVRYRSVEDQIISCGDLCIRLKKFYQEIMKSLTAY